MHHCAWVYSALLGLGLASGCRACSKRTVEALLNSCACFLIGGGVRFCVCPRAKVYLGLDVAKSLSDLF